MVTSDSLLFESPYIRRSRRAQARCRLICFPHVGAGVSLFNDWPGLLPPEVEVVGVQLPGRQDRIAERPFTDVDRLVVTLTHVIRPLLTLPVAFFGHSGGALLAFELARALERGATAEAEVIGVFPSGQAAPHLPLPPAVHDLPSAEFQRAMLRLGGTTEGVAADPALMSYLEPFLRADFRLWNTYRFRPGRRLTAPVLAFGGHDDEQAPHRAVEAWGEHTSGLFALRMFPGGHFFVNDATTDLVQALGDSLSRTLQERTVNDLRERTDP
jgi:surfactin synthase thioesterase subunit